MAISDNDCAGCEIDGSMRRFLQKDHRRVAASVDFDRARKLFGSCSAGFLFGSLRELVIVLRDSEHYVFHYGIAHIPCERANFLGPHAPMGA